MSSAFTDLVKTIIGVNAQRQGRDRRKATIERNVARGRCETCRKKPYDCRCAK